MGSGQDPYGAKAPPTMFIITYGDIHMLKCLSCGGYFTVDSLYQVRVRGAPGFYCDLAHTKEDLQRCQVQECFAVVVNPG